jgi:hypothetical protein
MPILVCYAQLITDAGARVLCCAVLGAFTGSDDSLSTSLQ